MRKTLKFLIIVCLVFANLQVVLAYDYPGANVMLNSALSATSYQPGGEPWYATDGLASTKWISQPTDAYTPNVLRITLPTEETITRWVVKNYSYAEGSGYQAYNTRDYYLCYWVNGVSYTIDGVTGNSDPVTDRIIKPIKVKELEIMITVPNSYMDWVTRICEVELYNSNNIALKAFTYTTDAADAVDGNLASFWTNEDYTYNKSFTVNFSKANLIYGYGVKNAGAYGLDPRLNTRDFDLYTYYNGEYSGGSYIRGNTLNKKGVALNSYTDSISFYDITPVQPNAPDALPRIGELEVFSHTPNPLDIVVDNQSSRCNITGSWIVKNDNVNQTGDNYYSTTKGPGYVFYQVNVPKPGLYDIYFKWFSDGSSCTSVNYTIFHGIDAVTTLPINQTLANGTWYHAGKYYVDRGKGVVKISVPEVPAGKISIDAVRFKWATDNLAIGATTNASSTAYYYGKLYKIYYYYASNTVDGHICNDYGSTHTWKSIDGGPEWLELTFSEKRKFNHVIIYFPTSYPLRDYELRYYNGSSWQTLEYVYGNTANIRYHWFDPVVGSQIQIYATSGPTSYPDYICVNEVQVFMVE